MTRLKLCQAIGDRGVFGFRNGLGIKETAGVVKFDLLKFGRVAALAFCLVKREVYLFSNGAGRHGIVEGVLP